MWWQQTPPVGHKLRIASGQYIWDSGPSGPCSRDKFSISWVIYSSVDVCFQSTFDGHSNYIHDVAVTSSGNQCISASEDGTVKIWGRQESVAFHHGSTTLLRSWHSFYAFIWVLDVCTLSLTPLASSQCFHVVSAPSLRQYPPTISHAQLENSAQRAQTSAIKTRAPYWSTNIVSTSMCCRCYVLNHFIKKSAWSISYKNRRGRTFGRTWQSPCLFCQAIFQLFLGGFSHSVHL